MDCGTARRGTRVPFSRNDGETRDAGHSPFVGILQTIPVTRCEAESLRLIKVGVRKVSSKLPSKVLVLFILGSLICVVYYSNYVR